MKPKIGITMGDPGGIGPEVALKSLLDPGISSQFDALLIGVPQVFETVRHDLDLPLFLSLVPDVASGFPAEGRCLEEGRGQHPGSGLTRLYRPTGFYGRPRRKSISVVACGQLSALKYGEASAEGGESSFQAIELAARMALDGKIDAVVTAPISKYSLHLARHPYPGHTELLSSLTKTEKYVMMLLSGDYRVALVTTHVALREVADSLSSERIFETIELTHHSLRRHFKLMNPRIGVCSLNPHGGETGLFGDEEDKKIQPAISRAQKEGMRVDGPLPSDTLFTRWKEFDSIVAMYHDQGLIPLKLLGFGRGVNFTLGLPFIRTSPDHGTAFDIAGKGIADPGSMVEAVNLASRLSVN